MENSTLVCYFLFKVSQPFVNLSVFRFSNISAEPKCKYIFFSVEFDGKAVLTSVSTVQKFLRSELVKE